MSKFADHFFSMLEQLRNTGSRNEKIEILKRNDETVFSPHFRVLFDYILNTNEHLYHMTQLPDMKSDADGRDMEALFFFEILENLKKRSGHSAQNFLISTLQEYNSVYQDLMQIVLDRDLKAGVGVKTLNKALDLNIQEFAVMKGNSICKDGEVDYSALNFPLIAQLKVDGFRCSVIVDTQQESVTFLSSSGKNLAYQIAIEKELLSESYSEKLKDIFGDEPVVFDCELAYDGEGNQYQETSKRVTTNAPYDGTDMKLEVFHILSYKDWIHSLYEPVHNEDTIEAVEFMNDFFGAVESELVRPVEGWTVRSVAEAKDKMKQVVAQNKEGLMLKEPHQPYHRKRVKGWFKWKFEDFYDCTIVDTVEGTGKLEGALGAFVVEYKGVQVRAGGSYKKSLTDDMRQQLWIERKTLVDRKVRVIANGVTADGSLRHPRFVNFHEG